ncbi:hypothetical protein [Bosea sp. (in: a-proteobacteria)]|uniref:hypothetical protein n=1 Tax=Bosea sp. (in: a-proteobacteria) TaxID=1871050 RepID=UPI002B49FDC2|nr:hypothetical protein [Bosea sp. (in: a-proteobacteria)]WRH56686.1 MAG: hypothetical protein RSE11_16790 [Bosea sp. (in: a-proteobacteria)]
MEHVLEDFNHEMLVEAVRELAIEVEAVRAMVSACSVAIVAAVSAATKDHPHRVALATGLVESLESQVVSYDGSPASQRLRLRSEQELLRIAATFRLEFGLPPRASQAPS